MVGYTTLSSPLTIGARTLRHMGSTLQERMQEAAKDMGARFNRADLQRAANVTRATVSHWFTGRIVSLTGTRLIGAARYFGVRPEWLSRGEGPKRADSLTAEERELLDLFRKMDDAQREATLGVARLGRMISNPIDPPIPPAPPLPGRATKVHEERAAYRRRP